MRNNLTYKQLLSTVEWLVQTKAVSLNDLGISELAYEKAVTGQRILSQETASKCFEIAKFSEEETPTKESIQNAIQSKEAERMKWSAEIIAREKAREALTDKELIDTISDADLKASNPTPFGPNGTNEENLAWAESIEDALQAAADAKADAVLDNQITVVFQGGGTKGAFQAGSLLYLGQNWDRFDIKETIGASTGSFAALHLTAYGAEAGLRLATYYSAGEEGDFHNWSTKYSEVHRVFSRSAFPKKLDEFLQDRMRAYPNRFKVKSLKKEMESELLVISQTLPEVVYSQEENASDGGDDSGLIGGITSDDLYGLMNKVKWGMIAVGAANLFVPYADFVLSGLLMGGANFVQDIVDEYIRAYQGIEMMEENTKGIMNSGKIRQTIQEAADYMAAHPNEIGLHAAVTSLNDTRLHWVDKTGNFGKDGRHQRGNPVLPEDQFVSGILASMAFPAIFDPIAIPLPNGGDKVYLDGGIRENCGIGKAYGFAGRKVLVINCSPSPLERWPEGISQDEQTTSALFKTILLDIFEHEGDLAERHPRIPFPNHKKVAQINPGVGLIGLLEADTGCALASMLVGYLYTQVALYEEVPGVASSRGLLKGYVSQLETKLRDMLLIERGMFFRGVGVHPHSNQRENQIVEVNGKHVDLIGDKEADFFFCMEHIESLRQVKKEAIDLLQAYVLQFRKVTNIKMVLPEAFGHLEYEDLFLKISYPVGKAIFKNAEEKVTTSFSYEYQKSGWTQEGTEYRLRRVSNPIVYSDLWGRFSFKEEAGNVIDAEAPPSLEAIHAHVFPAAPTFPMPTKPLFTKEINDEIYESTGAGKDFDLFALRNSVVLKDENHHITLFVDNHGRYEMYTYNQEQGTLGDEVGNNLNWVTINSEDNTLLSLSGTHVLEINHSTHAFRLFNVDFHNLAAEGPFSPRVREKQGQLKIFRDQKILLKRPGAHQQLISIDRQTRKFEIHAYSLAEGQPFMQENSLIWEGNLPFAMQEADTFEFLNERVLVQKHHYVAGEGNFTYKFWHVDIDRDYKTLVHYVPVNETFPSNSTNNNTPTAIKPLDENRALYLMKKACSVRSSRFRFES